MRYLFATAILTAISPLNHGVFAQSAINTPPSASQSNQYIGRTWHQPAAADCDAWRRGEQPWEIAFSLGPRASNSFFAGTFRVTPTRDACLSHSLKDGSFTADSSGPHTAFLDASGNLILSFGYGKMGVYTLHREGAVLRGVLVSPSGVRMPLEMRAE